MATETQSALQEDQVVTAGLAACPYCGSTEGPFAAYCRRDVEDDSPFLFVECCRCGGKAAFRLALPTQHTTPSLPC